jgi:predicted RecA/RadA family phage recombinase
MTPAMTPAMAVDLVDTLGEALKSGDVTAVLQCFAADGDVIYAGSETDEVAVGTAALASLLEELFARNERYSWRSSTAHVLVCTAGAVVVAEAALTVHAVADGAAIETDLPYRITGLLEPAHDRWVWRMCQSAEPTAVLATAQATGAPADP